MDFYYSEIIENADSLICYPFFGFKVVPLKSKASVILFSGNYLGKILFDLGFSSNFYYKCGSFLLGSTF